ncbi:MAG TPA: hypothetical protein VLW51_10950 [Solirubrobacteraceae bacterium]|nr:hypothetical protein [Solirubrobacteraceae bacterium]
MAEPFLLAVQLPTIYHCGEHGLEAIEYEDADPVRPDPELPRGPCSRPGGAATGLSPAACRWR